ncbi:hypothetical protein BGZ49_007064 [Haplosporangium sp. Z 27]|nr:hypothetical protein BGZ49_007064 [Haplosporangium sp. Z 27]
MLANQTNQGPSLSIVAHNATLLKDVELMGKQDPYVRFSLNFTEPKSFQKTFTHKNAGKNPVWNQSFNFPLNGEPQLYVEIMDEETTADAVIGFTAIPINQVVHAPGGSFNGLFAVYTPDGKDNGEVHLTLTAYNVPGGNTAGGIASQTPVRGVSQIDTEHQKRVKSIHKKEKVADAGVAIAGGLFALGAGLLANKVIGDEKKKEEARKEHEAEEVRQHERFEDDKRKLEEERANFERTRQEQERAERERQEQERSRGNEHHNREHHHKEHHERREGRDWDPVGNYSAGDRVSYHGHVYVCLQSHDSNPTWMPTEAHSLWRRD